MYVIFSRKFIKQRGKVPKKVREAFDERLKLFINHSYDPLLNNHALKGLYFGCRSINVTGDWRAVYEEVDLQTVNFVDLGTHSQLYK